MNEFIAGSKAEWEKARAKAQADLDMANKQLLLINQAERKAREEKVEVPKYLLEAMRVVLANAPCDKTDRNMESSRKGKAILERIGMAPDTYSIYTQVNNKLGELH